MIPQPQTATRAMTEQEVYRQKRKEQLLQQAQAIQHLEPDVNGRKLRHLINSAIQQAFL
jgi:hypothetical protein